MQRRRWRCKEKNLTWKMTMTCWTSLMIDTMLIILHPSLEINFHYLHIPTNHFQQLSAFAAKTNKRQSLQVE